MVLDDADELVSWRYLCITPIYDSVCHYPKLIVHKMGEGVYLSLLLCKFIKGFPDLFDKVIEVSRPVKFTNEDGKSW